MVLFIDTSDRYRRVVRLTEGKKVIAEEVTDGDVLVAVEKLLKKQKVKLEDLEKVEAYPGPGSFTGLRIGVSIANALNFALGHIDSKEIAIPKYGKEPNITKSKRISRK